MQKMHFINKDCGGKKPGLRNGWFEKEGSQIMQSKNFVNDKNELVLNRI